MKRYLMLLTMVMFFVIPASIYPDQQTYQPGDQSLLAFPTAYTMPKGSHTLTSFMIIILQYTGAITDNTHLTAASFFPVSAEALRSVTPGLKHRYLNKGKYQAAGILSYNPYIKGGHVGSVFSYGEPRKSLHFGINAFYSFKDDYIPVIFYLGGRYDLNDKVSLLGEFASSTEIIEEEFDGMMFIGVRFRGENISWDLGGFRPLFETDSDLFLLPFLKATVNF